MSFPNKRDLLIASHHYNGVKWTRVVSGSLSWCTRKCVSDNNQKEGTPFKKLCDISSQACIRACVHAQGRVSESVLYEKVKMCEGVCMKIEFLK